MKTETAISRISDYLDEEGCEPISFDGCTSLDDIGEVIREAARSDLHPQDEAALLHIIDTVEAE